MHGVFPVREGEKVLPYLLNFSCSHQEVGDSRGSLPEARLPIYLPTPVDVSLRDWNKYLLKAPAILGQRELILYMGRKMG